LIIDAQNPVVACTNRDEWRLNGADCVKVGATKSIAAHPEDFGKSPIPLDYCLIVPIFNHLTVSTRYSTTYACASTAIEPYSRLKGCVESHDNKLDAMTSSFNALDTKMTTIFNAVKSTKTYIESTRDKFKESNAFVKDSGTTLAELTSCKIMRREARNLLGNGCYKFMKYFSIQSIILLILGPLMVILSFYILCAVKHSEKVEKKTEEAPHSSRHQVPQEEDER
jgi:hypothetical protein